MISTCIVLHIKYCLKLSGVATSHQYGNNGASHGGIGGRGPCRYDNQVNGLDLDPNAPSSCKLLRSKPYGNAFLPRDFGSGGVLDSAAIGMLPSNTFKYIKYFNF